MISKGYIFVGFEQIARDWEAACRRILGSKQYVELRKEKFQNEEPSEAVKRAYQEQLKHVRKEDLDGTVVSE